MTPGQFCTQPPFRFHDPWPTWLRMHPRSLSISLSVTMPGLPTAPQHCTQPHFWDHDPSRPPRTLYQPHFVVTYLVKNASQSLSIFYNNACPSETATAPQHTHTHWTPPPPTPSLKWIPGNADLDYRVKSTVPMIRLRVELGISKPFSKLSGLHFDYYHVGTPTSNPPTPLVDPSFSKLFLLLSTPISASPRTPPTPVSKPLLVHF